MRDPVDVLVVGGGINGLSSALHLARRGARVVLLEKDRVARHASGVNFGGIRRLMRDEAEVPLALEAIERWHHAADLLGAPCGFVANGQLVIAEAEADFERLKRRAARMLSLGWTHEQLIEGDDLFELVPAAARHCRGGLHAPGDGSIHPFVAATAFRRAAEAAGATIREGVTVEAIARHGDHWQATTASEIFRARHLVNAGGAWAGRLAASIGEPVPVEVISPMLTVTTPRPAFLGPVVLGVTRRCSIRQAPNGTVLVGGAHQGRPDLATGLARVDHRNLKTNAQAVLGLFPSMRDAAIVRTWSGIEARTSDDLPILGPSETEPDLVHAFGFSAHGFALGPVTGEIVADLVVDGTTRHPIRPFRIGRFTRTDAAEIVARIRF
jgi:sarcosine oxidase subunit beta